MKFVVETSARHVHVTQEDLETLFGKGHELTKKKDLSQPGQFACEEKVTIVGSNSIYSWTGSSGDSGRAFSDRCPFHRCGSSGS